MTGEGGGQEGPEPAAAGAAAAPAATVSLEDVRAFLRRLFHRCAAYTFLKIFAYPLLGLRVVKPRRPWPSFGRDV